MINLIPPDAEKAVKHEYRIRVVTVYLFLLALACMILTILHIPTYLLLRAQLRAYEGEFATMSVQTSEYATAEKALKNANTVIDTLSKEERQPLFSSVLAESIMPKGITPEGYTFTRKNGALGGITVSGTSIDRASLSQFRKAIEEHKRFKTATLPIANLAKDKDIPFSISIIPEDNT
jgi:hypothetical protein